MIVENVNKVSNRIIEFDIYITSSHEIFKLTSYQCSFLFNPDIANGGQLSFVYVEGTSQLRNKPSAGVGINYIDSQPKLTFASLADSDIISSQRLRVGRFNLRNSTNFSDIKHGFSWNFEGNISTILTGESFQNITIPINFHYGLVNDPDSILHKSSPQNKQLIGDLKLFQNHPNPFNPDTKITFNIAADGHVNLIVYSLLGQEITVIADNNYSAGTHSFNFNGGNFPSGVYICKLKVNNKHIETIKMLLIR